MGLVVPHPASDLDLKGAGYNGDGEFIIKSRGAQAVRVPDDWRVPLASHLTADVGLFDAGMPGLLRKLQQKAAKKRGNTITSEEAAGLGRIAHALECLIQEYLEADPRTSTRYEYRPSYYDDGLREYIAMRTNLGPPAEPLEDLPVPW